MQSPPAIRVLPKELAEKIAAGEVVERPGSVIKELVENSLDAGARNIAVQLEDGGSKRISVFDDGCGIADDEISTALLRHATSKISSLDDLWNLRTMGFRGEALPSIAAVSRFTIESRVMGQKGRRIYLEGGNTLKEEASTSQKLLEQGTHIVVEDLFFNVPARLKFLRAKSSESAHIRELLERLALCNPQVGFTLTADSRKTLALPSARDDIERTAAVFGIKIENIETIEARFEDISVRGWLDRDARASNSRSVFLSVNGRMVRDKLLQQAVLTALRPRMMEGEYPKIYLAVDVQPDQVDVNVHPAKSEVRFQKSRDVFQVVHGALNRLAKEPSKPFYSAGLAETPTAVPNAPIPTPPIEQLHPRLFEDTRYSFKKKEYPPSVNAKTEDPLPFNPSPLLDFKDDLKGPGFSRLHYIGQLKNTYLLFQDAQGLILIDQHAAHERINYEKTKADFLASGLKAQPLLLSAIVKCKPDEIGLALDQAETFQRLGFEFEAFGDHCLLLRTAPEGLTTDRASELFRSLLDEMRDSEAGELAASDPSRLSAKVERMLATTACHASIRAGQGLSSREAHELASQMDDTPASLNCPHGRPVSVRLTLGQIEGLFKRV